MKTYQDFYHERKYDPLFEVNDSFHAHAIVLEDGENVCKPEKCYVCAGTGKTHFPRVIPGDTFQYETAEAECKVCKGSGKVWRPVE